MPRTTLTLVTLLVFAASAGAEAPPVVRALEKSYELGFGDIVFPATPVGSVNVKPCASCPRVAHYVTPITQYLHGDRQMSFDELRKWLEDRRATSRPTYVGVHYSVDTNRVTRIRLKTE